MSQTESFKVHDLVWGKMKSFPPWPGMVVDPTDENIGEKPKKSNNYCVYFFGSHNFTWLDEKCVQPYQEFKQAYSNISKQASFLEAVKLIEEYIESGATGLPPSREKPKKKSIVNGNTSSQGFATPKDKVRKRKSIPQKSFSSLDNYEKFPKTPRLRLSLIDRPPRSDPEIAVTDLKDVSQNLKDKKIIPTSMTIGFLGLGIMGSRIAKNILLSGHKLMVWNRTPSKSEQFEEAGAEVGPTPADVILGSDITFSCVSDPKAAKELVFGNCGVLSEMSSGKGFVELTSIDADTSKEIADSIHEKGGRYLEAQMVGSLHEVEEGKLVFLCAGDESLFNDCQTCFRSCSERTPNYLGPTGSAVNMNLVYQAIQGIMVASLAEGLSLLQRMDLPQNVFLEAFKRSSVYCPLFEEKINMILNEKFPTSLPLQHHQKDLKLALTLGTEVGQPMPLTAAVNELYKHARRLGFGEHDTSSVYVIFVVGSNSSETVFRVLKIDRTCAKDDLVLIDDGVEYSKIQISNYVTKIEGGRSRSGNMKGLCAFGILGFVKFLEGYYLILITKRRRIAIVGLHSVYKIEDTTMIYVPNESNKGAHPDEARYLKMFVNIDLSSNFYYSYSYDITNTVQVNMAVPENFNWSAINKMTFAEAGECGSATSLNTTNPEFGRLSPISKDKTSSKNASKEEASEQSQFKITDFAVGHEPNKKFIWNLYLISKMIDRVHSDWILYVIHGFICQSNISIFGRSIYLTLIARRSNRYAGTRFLKRGANFQGDVANEVETEQIVQDLGVTSIRNPHICSFVQMRGSIPGHWSQDVTKIVPKPAIAYDISDPYVQTAGKHFEKLLKSYGSPIIVLNLVKQRETKKHESTLSEQYSSDIKYLNQFLPPQHAIQYVTFDMARKNKGKEATVMIRLGRIAQSAIEKTGIFVSHRNEVQTGIIRVNCVDCLDRTNTAQFALGKCALTFQLKYLGLLSSANLEFDCDCTRLLEALYEDHGDTLALQYGGSQLVHRIKTYRKTAPWTSQGNDIMQTLSRYYSNTFSDQEKQHAINLFLGLYKPSEMSTPIWELSTDYYIHNPLTIDVPNKHRRPLTQWWSDGVMCCLPKPHSYLYKKVPYIIPLQGTIPEWVDVYADFHKIHEFTTLHDISAFIMSHTVRDFMPHCVTNYSPFIVRVQPGRRREETAKGATIKNPSLSGQSSTSSTTSSASSSNESDEEETKMSDSRQSSPAKHSSNGSNSVHTFRNVFPNMRTTYGIGITKPSKSDTLLYKRYVLMSQTARRSLVQATLPSRAYAIASVRKPITVFPPDSSYQTTVPKVSKESKEIYKCYVSKHKNINSYLTPVHAEKYARYINNQMYIFPTPGWESNQ